MKKVKTIKQLFDEKKKLVRSANDIGRQLDAEIMKTWGFSFSETDDDPMIDTLGYGTNSISFDEFKRRMDHYRDTRNEDGSFVALF